jgi:hypothetical protein
LLALEPENFDPLTGERLELRLNATASKNYDLYTLFSSALTLVKWSEHGLGHLFNPSDSTGTDADWIREGRQHLLARRLGLRTSEPHWWDAPSLSVLRLNRPGELARLQAALPDAQLRPFSRIIVALPGAVPRGTRTALAAVPSLRTTTHSPTTRPAGPTSRPVNRSL